MKKLRITIVDSGVRCDHPAYQGDCIKGFTYLGNGEVSEDFTDTYGHGTAVYGIIRKTLEYADILNIRIPNIEMGIDSDTLCSLLNYIADSVETDLLNLSLGVCIVDNLAKLRQACNRLEEKNVIIVSAFDNSGAISYPAAFSNVIGVTTGNQCHKPTDFEYQENEIVNLAAMGSMQRLNWLAPDYLFLGGNSFACAHTTVQAAFYMSKGFYIKKAILSQFQKKSVTVRKAPPTCIEPMQLFPITRAVLFPFCKEMHSLLRFRDLLTFDIADIYDIKYSATIGANTRILMQDPDVPEFIIKNIEKIDWESFDTLILGHMQKLSSLIEQQGFFYNIIKEAIFRQKKIVAFDDLSEVCIAYPNALIYYPKVDRHNLPSTPFGKLYRSSKPTIGVFGTSSRQGKFTLQLTLRRILLQRGYHIAQLGTEPSALLYGMDEVYPMGYNSSVYLSGYDAIRYLNSRMNHLCEKDIDLILVGCQSGTVPYDTGNIEQYTCSQYDFLMGTLPDAVILCINPYDELEYIDRTIKFIEATAESKVIAIVLFPLDLKEQWKGLYGKKTIVEKSKIDLLTKSVDHLFHLPLFLLGNEQDMLNLTDCILNYF